MFVFISLPFFRKKQKGTHAISSRSCTNVLSTPFSWRESSPRIFNYAKAFAQRPSPSSLFFFFFSFPPLPLRPPRPLPLVLLFSPSRRYTCTATHRGNASTFTSAEVLVHVMYKPSILTEPADYTRPVKESTHFFVGSSFFRMASAASNARVRERGERERAAAVCIC